MCMRAQVQGSYSLENMREKNCKNCDKQALKVMKSRQDTLWKMLLVKNKEISIIKRFCVLCIFSLFLVCQMIDNMSIIPSSSTVFSMILSCLYLKENKNLIHYYLFTILIKMLSCLSVFDRKFQAYGICSLI